MDRTEPLPVPADAARLQRRPAALDAAPKSSAPSAAPSRATPSPPPVSRGANPGSTLEPSAAPGERGIFQIHPVHRAWLGARWARLFDPVENARAARDLHRRAGWQPWTTADACT